MAVCTAGYAIAIVVTAYHPQTQQVRFGVGGSLQSPQLIEFDAIPTVEQIAASFQGMTFLHDERGSAAYRQHITQVLMQRGIAELASGTEGPRRY